MHEYKQRTLHYSIKVKSITIILFILIPIIFTFINIGKVEALPVPGSIVNFKSGTAFYLSSYNNYFTLTDDMNFRSAEENNTHLTFTNSYSTHHYSAYILSSNNSNINLQINSFFSAKTSSATFTLINPTSSNIFFEIYSPNLITATVSGAVNYKIINNNVICIVNTDINNQFTIYMTVNETFENNAPEVVLGSFSITNIEDDNYIFSQDKYYLFKGRFYDLDGYADLEEMEIKFYILNINLIEINYNRNTGYFTLISGSDYVTLKPGTATIINNKILEITFPIYLKDTVFDENDIDLYAKCSDIYDSSTSWILVLNNYFNIYNLGGAAEYLFSGDGNHIIGGDVFELNASTIGSWAYVSVIYRKFQHIHVLFNLNTGNIKNGTYNYMVCPSDHQYTGTLEWAINYKDPSGVWVKGWSIVIDIENGEVGGYGTLPSQYDKSWVKLRVRWYQNEVLIKTDYFISYHWAYSNIDQLTGRPEMKFWLDLWFNEINASSVVGGRIVPYWYGMAEQYNVWTILGSKFVPLINGSQSMFFTNLVDHSGNTIHAQQLDFMKISANISKTGCNDPWSLTDFDILNIKRVGPSGGQMVGIATPSSEFQPAQNPFLPEGTFLGGLLGAFGNLGKIFANALIFVFSTLISGLDSIFINLGLGPIFSEMINIFIQLPALLSTLMKQLTTSLIYISQYLYNIFLFAATFAAHTLTVIGYLTVGFINLWNNFYNILNGVLTGTANWWELLGIGQILLYLLMALPIIITIYIFNSRNPITAIKEVYSTLELVLGWVWKLSLFILDLIITIISAIFNALSGVIP